MGRVGESRWRERFGAPKNLGVTPTMGRSAMGPEKPALHMMLVSFYERNVACINVSTCSGGRVSVCVLRTPCIDPARFIPGQQR